MNVHHLELFYYVAKHGGIMPAVRNIPYGIQQPAVSSQMAQLEEFLGVTLFQRRPFALTTKGKNLYDFIAPFFANLDKVAEELQGGQTRHIRIGASPIILRDHLPGLLRAGREKIPKLTVFLREGYPADLENMLLREELDLVITLIERKPPATFRSLALAKLPLVLLVNKDSDIASVKELWQRDRIQTPLVSLPAAESITKIFQEQLRKRNVDWFPSIEASSLDLIETYVANGLGAGVSLALPGKKFLPQIRVLPLPDFPPTFVGALWRGKASPLLQVFLDELSVRAKQLA